MTEAVTESGPQGDGDRPVTEEDRLGMDGDKLGMEGDDAGIKGGDGEGMEGDVASQLSQVSFFAVYHVWMSPVLGCRF